VPDQIAERERPRLVGPLDVLGGNARRNATGAFANAADLMEKLVELEHHSQPFCPMARR
jgi:hypothetical protein